MARIIKRECERLIDAVAQRLNEEVRTLESEASKPYKDMKLAIRKKIASDMAVALQKVAKLHGLTYAGTTEALEQELQIKTPDREVGFKWPLRFSAKQGNPYQGNSIALKIAADAGYSCRRDIDTLSAEMLEELLTCTGSLEPWHERFTQSMQGLNTKRLFIEHWDRLWTLAGAATIPPLAPAKPKTRRKPGTKRASKGRPVTGGRT